ncbi:trigger factor [Atopobacter phocae]|uniref:trigger factor n=1 Tax=Atopobacter phocae TaxID=136492 RepID=UPI0004729E3F|nr:trigger factor [Atopobacter phocae]
MSVKFDKKEKSYGELIFTITEEEKNHGLDHAFNKVKKNISVPGFRKGKVSRTVFNRMFGEESLYEEALNHALPTAYMRALSEADVHPVSQPEIDVLTLEKGKDWEIKARFAIKPEVKLGQFEGLEVAKQDREVSEEEVEEAIKALQQTRAELVLKEDAPAELGDTVVIDYKGFIDEVAFEGGEDKNHSLELGSGQFIPGFEDQLVGTKEGDETKVTVTFPEEYQAADLAGKEAIFEVTVHEVKTKELPELDDEFAKDVNEDYETLADLKQAKKEELENQKSELANEKVQEEAIRAAIENAEIVDLPKEMVEEEVNRQVEHYLNNMRRQGIEPDLYFQITNTTEQDLRDNMAVDADIRVKTNLILEQIVKDKEIQVSEEEIQEEIENLSKEYQMDLEQVKQVVSNEMLTEDIKMKKALALITDTAVEK